MLEDLSQWDPHKVGGAKELPSSETSKLALGAHSPANEKRAREMAERALGMAREAGQLIEAADLMEEAFNQWPQLRDEYEYRLKLWRRGIAM